jgi:phosphatidylglycerophosphate synthase
MRRAGDVPPFRDFLARRFAVPGPFWSWMLFERIGGALAYGFARVGLSPTAATLLGGAAGVAGAVVWALAKGPASVIGALALLWLAYALDCSDGQLARATGRASAFGAWLDVTVDSVIVAFMTCCVTLALLEGAGPLSSVAIGGAFGAARTANLFTSSLVRREHGGMAPAGFASRLRTAYRALIDTPFVYAVLCATRLAPHLLQTAVLLLTALTVVQTLVSAQHHFASTRPSRTSQARANSAAAGSSRPSRKGAAV